uniref:Leucine rich adaptor protein 1 n=1 Tax=Bubo bubo TaxID=30461 RepID=A0A8C0IB26_BUBBB
QGGADGAARSEQCPATFLPGPSCPASCLPGLGECSGLRSAPSASSSLLTPVPVGDSDISALNLFPRGGWWPAYLRAVDVKILQQLVVVNEGIEAVKWLLEERSTLTSRCSSLASSQYSLVESQAASRRGSWDSLQDPNDKLDSISVGSYLDTLADDMDEYSQNAAETTEPGRDTKLPSGAGERLGKGNPGGKARKYDAHWRWLQSQDDVTFL